MVGVTMTVMLNVINVSIVINQISQKRFYLWVQQRVKSTTSLSIRGTHLNSILPIIPFLPVRFEACMFLRRKDLLVNFFFKSCNYPCLDYDNFINVGYITSVRSKWMTSTLLNYQSNIIIMIKCYQIFSKN